MQKDASSYEKENFKRHYETNHPELKNLDGELRKVKIEEFKEKSVHPTNCHDFLLQYKRQCAHCELRSIKNDG